MKPMILFQLILAGAILLCLKSCEFSAFAKTGSTSISGKVKNAENLPNEVRLDLYYYDPKTGQDLAHSFQTKMDDAGAFEISTSKIKQPYWYGRLFIGYESTLISIEPGDQLFVSLDAKEFDETLKYSGKGAAKNNYQVARYLRFEDKKEGISFEHKYLLDFPEYQSWRETLQNEQFRLLDSIDAVTPIGKNYLTYERDAINWKYFNDLRIHQVKHNKSNYEEVKTLLQNMPFNESLFFHRTTFREKLPKYITFMSGKNPSPRQQVEKSRELLTDNMLEYYDQHCLAEFMDKKGAEDVLNILESEGASSSLISKLTLNYETINKLRKVYPEQTPNLTYFGDNNAIDTFKVSGQVINYSGKQKHIRAYTSPITGEGEISGKIQKDGTFTLEIPAAYSHTVFMSFERAYTYMIASPGDQTFVRIKGRGMTFYGDGEQMNNRLNEYVRTVRFLEDAFRYNPMEDQPEIVLQKIQQKEEAVRKFNTQFINESDSPIFVEAIGRRIEFSTNYELLSYPLMMKNARKPNPKLPEYVMPEGFTVKPIALSKKDLLQNQAYDLIRMRTYQVSQEYENLLERLDVYKQTFTPFEYEIAMAMQMGYLLNDYNFEEAQLLSDRMQVEMHTSWLKAHLMNQLAHKREVFDGMVIPAGADLTTAAETSADSLLQQIIAKHKGKTIYMDFWATWCGPCIGEFAFAEDFHKGIDHDKVSMVYLAGHSKERPWQMAIKKNNLKGDHYLHSVYKKS